LLHQVHWVQGVGLARPWGAAALVDAADCALGAQDDRAACQGLLILSMPDQDAWNIGYGVVAWHAWILPLSVDISPL
jgi:hypothetical protein